MDINIGMFYNDNTLNIFSDASIIGNADNFTGCYGAVAVVGDDIIDQTYRLVSNTTNNNSEIKGIRGALFLAHKYRNTYKNINIFSDSLISINGLRSYIYNWKIKNGELYSISTGRKIANQNIFIECHNLLKELENAPCIITLYHQSGHVDSSYRAIVSACKSFNYNNNIRGKIDLNFIRYISTWNNHVDSNSRSMLKRNRNNKNIYTDPIEFTANYNII